MVAKFPIAKRVKVFLVKIDLANFLTNSLKSACVSTVGLMSKYYTRGEYSYICSWYALNSNINLTLCF